MVEQSHIRSEMDRISAPVDAVSITLKTERLYLRPVNQNDLTDIHEIVSDPEVTATAGFPISSTLEDSVKRMLEYMDDNETLAVVLKENNKMIGTVSLQKRHWPMYPIDRKLQGRELGFDLNRKYWGRGLMPEAVRAVTDYCFQKLNYDFLTAGYFLGNARSQRAIEKCAFEFLFEAEHENPGLWKKMICTYIKYNPHKEI
jgi:ribosomal-protein-alanine N-acetyltransferase